MSGGLFCWKCRVARLVGAAFRCLLYQFRDHRPHIGHDHRYAFGIRVNAIRLHEPRPRRAHVAFLCGRGI